MAAKTSKESKERMKSQQNKFVKAARELECDEDEKRFNKKLGKIAKAKPLKKSS